MQWVSNRKLLTAAELYRHEIFLVLTKKNTVITKNISAEILILISLYYETYILFNLPFHSLRWLMGNFPISENGFQHKLMVRSLFTVIIIIRLLSTLKFVYSEINAVWAATLLFGKCIKCHVTIYGDWVRKKSFSWTVFFKYFFLPEIKKKNIIFPKILFFPKNEESLTLYLLEKKTIIYIFPSTLNRYLNKMENMVKNDI